MKKKLVFSVFSLCISVFSFSQIQLTCGNNFYDSGGSSGMYSSDENTSYLISPGLPTDAVQVVFSSFSTEIDYDVLTVYDNNAASGTIIGQFSGDVNVGTLIAENPTGCLFFVFTTDGATIQNGWSAVVNCVTKPTCFKPINLSIPSKTHHTANFQWTSAGSETEWEVEYGASGFTPGSGTIVLTQAIPYLIEGLSVNTAYDVYIRAHCGGTNYSSQKGPLTFTTNPSPNPAFNCGNLFTDEGGAGSDYFNYANDTVVICPGSAGQHVSLIFSSFSTEQDFDSLMIFNGNSTSAPVLGTYSGDVNIGTLISTSVDGCLTAVFASDESTNGTGWSANITCSGSSTNTAPIAVNDGASTPFNTAVTINVLANDSDPGGALVPSSVTVTVPSPNGTTSVNTTTGAITFTPTTGFSGVATYTYQVCDNGTPALCATATVTIAVGVNGIVENAIQTRVYPNPVKDILNIETTETVNKVQILSMDGKVITRLDGNLSLNVSHLNKGIYILEVNLENGKTVRTQFIKE